MLDGLGSLLRAMAQLVSSPALCAKTSRARRVRRRAPPVNTVATRSPKTGSTDRLSRICLANFFSDAECKQQDETTRESTAERCCTIVVNTLSFRTFFCAANKLPPRFAISLLLRVSVREYTTDRRVTVAQRSTNNPPQMEVLPMFNQHDLIHRYTREQALKDGVLVDATQLARELGFRYGVALTKAAWERCVTIPEGVVGQDEVGRLWDVLHMLAASIRRGAEGREVPFFVHVRTSNRGGIPPAVPLVAVCGPGDDGEPVITVMLPGES